MYGKFLASDQTVAINTTQDVSASSAVMKLDDCRKGSITLYVKGGNAGCSKSVSFAFQAYNPALGEWDTTAYLTLTATLNGTNEVVVTYPVSPGVAGLRLATIANPETTSGYTVTANAAYFTD
jgi:hypothetical protein